MRLALISAIALSLSLGACARQDSTDSRATGLITGTRAPVPAAARASARRFASAYAPSIYDPSPSPVPTTTPEVALALRAAASRIPPSRRGLTPRAAGLALRPIDADRVNAALTVDDGRSPPFTVGFALGLRDGRWRVIQISPPG
jgi:hypothetical protein